MTEAVAHQGDQVGMSKSTQNTNPAAAAAKTLRNFRISGLGSRNLYLVLHLYTGDAGEPVVTPVLLLYNMVKHYMLETCILLLH